MNYRHAFHAGNHADVLKHSALAMALRRLCAKPKPLTALDFFAGAGRYDLVLDPRAQRTGEWRDGVARVWGAADAPAALAPYLEAIAAEQPAADAGRDALGLRRYPGSPALLQRGLRAEDRLVLVERHPEEAEALRAALGRDHRARVSVDDGWTAVKALTPPDPRRGLALLDPPFEAPSEFARLTQALEDGLRRWATGVYLLWHPVKDRQAVRAYERALARVAGDTPLLLAELRVKPDTASGLIGSGLAIANPPYLLDADLAAVGPWLADRLAGSAGAWRLDWLTPPR